jgi:lipopolysaccharide/colanic/teichoic acid biosynthesis glycosyltransferase
MWKRPFDVIVAATLLVAASPALLLVGLMVLITLGRPILFSQPRPGLREKTFWIYKFRTMHDTKDRHGNLLPDAMRSSAVGRMLRSTSLDELPALWNVLKGEMSLVGPRPLLVDYLPIYSAAQRRRHEVRPGITGWAQVNGRNDISWCQKFELDVWYIDNQSCWLDFRILFMTVVCVLKRSGISKPGHSTTDYFNGTN